MARLPRFRRRPRRTWTSPEDYGRVLPTAQWSGPAAAPRSRWGRAWLWLLGIALLAAWYLYAETARFEPPELLAGEPQPVSGAFTRCGARKVAAGPGAQCVVDGDTIRLGTRTIRLIGIDAPEIEARCPAEAAGAESASAALQVWLSAAPFELVARLDAPTDKWGRELMSARRVTGGAEQTAADALLAAGVVRPYAGEVRHSWC